MKLKTPIVMTLMSLGVACGGVEGMDPADRPVEDVRGYLEELPPWPEPEPDAEEPVAEPSFTEEIVDGVVYSCSNTEYSLTRTPEKLVTLNPGADIFWPGVLIQGQSYQGGLGSFAELPIRSRAPMKVSVDLLFSDNTRTVESPDLASVHQAVGEIIESARDANLEPQSSIDYNKVVSYSAEQAAVALGLSARYLSFEAKAKLKASKEAKKTTITAHFTQRAFSVSMVAPETPDRFFSSDFTAEDLEAQRQLGRIGPDNLPVYLSSISYGRVLLFSFTSEASKSEIVGTLNAVADGVVAGGSVSLSARQKEILQQSEISVFTLGGDDDAALALIRSGDLSDYFSVDNSITSFVPISYVLRNVGDNSIAKVSETTSYTVKECQAATGGDVPTDGLMVELLMNDEERIPGNPGAMLNTAPNAAGLDGVIQDGCRVAPGADRFGYADMAADFRGRGGCDAAEPSLIYLDGAGYADNFSYAIWVSGGGNGYLIGQPGGSHLELNASLASLVVESGPTLSDPDPVGADEWAFYVVSARVEGGETVIGLYRDGALVAEQRMNGTVANRRGGVTLIGNAVGGPDNVYPGRLDDFQGMIDDVRIYDRALDSDEIARLHVEGQ